MVVLRAHRAAAKSAAADNESVRQLFNMRAERGKHRRGRCEPVGLLEPEPRGIHNARFPFRRRGERAERGDKIGDGRGVDDRAVSGKRRQRKEQRGDILRGNVPGKRICPRRELSGAKELSALGPERHAAADKLTQKRFERALRQPSFPQEHRVRAECANDREQKTERRSALAAGQNAEAVRHCFDRFNMQRAILLRDVRAESTKARGRGKNVGVQPVAADRYRLLAERGADEQAVRLRFGSRDSHRAGACSRRNDKVHCAPPCRSHSA